MKVRQVKVSEATRIYQAYLEAYRTSASDLEEMMAEDLKRARRDMDVAWLESLHQRKEPA